MSKRQPAETLPELDVDDTITIDRQMIHEGKRFQPGEYRVIDEKDEDYTQETVDGEKVISLRAANDIQARMPRLLSRERQIRAKSIAIADPKLPADFPYREELEGQGLKTVGQVRAAGKQGLMGLRGIGKAKAEDIMEALDSMGENEAEPKQPATGEEGDE